MIARPASAMAATRAARGSARTAPPAAAVSRGTRHGQPPAPPAGSVAAARRHQSNWVFTEQHATLMKGLQNSAPRDLQVWTRLRKEAARKQTLERARSKAQRQQRSPIRSKGQPLQSSMGMQAPRWREPMQTILIQPDVQRVVRQHRAPPPNLKNPPRSSRERVMQRENLDEQRATQRQHRLAQIQQEREAVSAMAEAQLRAASKQLALATEEAVGGWTVAGKSHLEARLAELHSERRSGPSAELYRIVHLAPASTPGQTAPRPSTVRELLDGNTAESSLSAAAAPAPSQPRPSSFAEGAAAARRPAPPSPVAVRTTSATRPPHTPEAKVSMCTPTLDMEPPVSPCRASAMRGAVGVRPSELV